MPITVLRENRSVLFTAIQLLGEKSGKSYVILDARTSEPVIIECNKLYCDMTGNVKESIKSQSFIHRLLVDETEYYDITQRFYRGQIYEGTLMHERRDGSPFLTRCKCLPFQNVSQQTEFILIFVEELTQVEQNDYQTKIFNMNGQDNFLTEHEMCMVSHIKEAIKNKEIHVYFQPKIELRRGRIASMEALARWISPQLGFMSPAEFIPIAERAGLIREIDLLIIEQVLAWLQRRQYDGKRIVPISINISPDHFYHPEFITCLRELMHQYYADPNYIFIEVTENIGLVDMERAKEILWDLKLRGFKTSVDDFGIGFSSLSYLQKFAFCELKIDRSFTSKIQETGTYMIIRSIIQIARNLEIDIVAEGVETEQQVQLLKELGCEIAQGYLYYKPMSLDDIEGRIIL